MKVSIITVTFNSDKFLPSCIDSVARQKYSDIEYIIIDGKSSDNTIDIINQRASNISFFVSEPDSGIYDAMNKGISMASGDLIGFLNSDDFYVDDQVICDVVKAIERTGSDSLYSDLDYIDPSDTNRIVRKWISGAFNRRSFLFGWMPPHPTFFVKKEVFEKYGIFNTKFKTSADYELMLRFLFKKSISTVYLPRTTVKMRVGGISNSSLTHRLFANREDLLAWHVNGLKPFFFTVLLKPLRKVFQYIRV